MSLSGVMAVNFDVKSPAYKFFLAYMENINFPNEGNAESKIDRVGTEIKRLRFIMRGFKISNEWYKALKEALTRGYPRQDTADGFKKLEGTMTIIAKEHGDGADVEWAVNYEKISFGVADPDNIVATCVLFFKEMDENLLKSN